MKARKCRFAVWTGAPDAEAKPWLQYWDGQIDAKYPDKAFRVKMHEIAVALDARVQGDDGEYYGAEGEPLPPDQQEFLIREQEELEREHAARKPSLITRLFSRR